MQIQNLMLRREHFPIQVYETTGEKSRKICSIDRVEIPPYHPSMTVTGLLFESVPDLLYGVVESTVRDLEEIADKRSDVQFVLRDIVKNKKSGKVLFRSQIAEQDDFGIIIESVPIVDHFYVGRKKINPYDYHGDQGITINLELSHSLFFVPEKVTFTTELMREYEMTDRGLSLGKRQIECSNGWYRHNLETINAIFYKNLVISLNNEVVKKKYAQGKNLKEQGK